MDIRNFIRRCQSPDFFLVLYKTRKKSGYSVGETLGKNRKSRKKNLNKFLNANLQKTFLSYMRLERFLEIGLYSYWTRSMCTWYLAWSLTHSQPLFSLWSFCLLIKLTPGLRDFNSMLSSVVWYEERRADILLVNDFIIQNVSMVLTPCIFNI